MSLLVVLGMHRSGTSLLAGAVHRLGAALPRTPMPPAPDNPDGFFESAALVALNDAILQRAGSGWADWRRLAPGGLADGDPPLWRRMRDGLADEFPAGSPLAVWKDPRLSALLPVWRPLLADRSPSAFVVFRSPGAVARSLERRNGIPPGLALLLWLRHVLDAELHTRDLPRVFISFDALLADWRGALVRAAARLGRDWPVAPSAVGDDPVRKRPPDDDRPPLISSAYGAVWSRHALDACRALERGEPDRDGTGPRFALDRLRDQFDDACRLFGGERILAAPVASPPERAPSARPGARVALPEVTVVAADTRTPGLAADALGRALAVARFAEAVLFTDRAIAVPDGVRLERIDTIADADAYGRFLARDLAGRVATSHVLVVQWDGWPLDASAWDGEFLRCDYLGARWAGRPEGYSVGNGGFSLRSRRLLELLRDDDRLRLRPGIAEDEQIGGRLRPILEGEHGMRFAPEPVADRFSTERVLSAAASFGFHGAFNLWRHCDDVALVRVAEALPEAVRAARAVRELVRLLRHSGRDRAADALDTDRAVGQARPVTGGTVRRG